MAEITVNPVQSFRPSLQVLALASLVFITVLGLMKAFDVGCDNLLCHRNGYLYGIRLVLGSLVLAWLGRLYLLLVEESSQEFEFFTSIAVGLASLMAYVYLRSLFNQIAIDIPISRLEVFSILVALEGFVKFKQRSQVRRVPTARHNNRRIAIEFAILFAICIVIADRELPRELLLSSDPDVHAFFGFQVERFGGVPYQQHEWGSQGFNYPAGSGVILFIWKLIAGVDQRNSIAALPIFFTLLGSLLIAETLTTNIRNHFHRTLVLLSAISVTLGALLFPLYAEYLHMEGTARQLSILIVALFVRFAILRISDPEKILWKKLIFPAFLVFLLLALNPANVVVPGAIVFGIFIHGWILKNPDWKLFWVLLGGLILAGLDPFYHNMIGIAKEARVDTVIYTSKFVIKTLPQIADQTAGIWAHGLMHFAHDFSILLTEPGIPLFLPICALFATFSLFVLGRCSLTPTFAAIAGFIAFSISLYLVDGLASSLTDDRRYFLLAPYIFFSWSQYKALFVVLALIWITKKVVQSKKSVIWIVASPIFLIVATTQMVRSEQDMFLDPRQSYCGPFDCLHLDDRVLLRKFEKMLKANNLANHSGSTPKVLLPNLISQSEHEKWIFPVSGARMYPYLNVIPAAFYYYQGDVGYSTKSYLDHVCDRFDRAWLQSKNIQYIYLPTGRGDACVSGMESLITSEDIVLQEGNSYLLKLKPLP